MALMTASSLDVYENISALKVECNLGTKCIGRTKAPDSSRKRRSYDVDQSATDLQPATVMNPANPLAAFRIRGPPDVGPVADRFFSGEISATHRQLPESKANKHPSLYSLYCYTAFIAPTSKRKRPPPDILLILFFFCVTKQY